MWLDRLRSTLKPLADAWFRADPRTLALFRISFGILVMVDVLRRLPYLTLMYSDSGVLPNQAIIEHPFSRYTFSLLLSLGSPGEATVFFWVILAAAAAFTVGYRTKLAHVAMAIGVISIHSKNILVENGGDQVMNIFAMWSLFLPLGERFSFDVVRKRLRSHRETSTEHLNDLYFVPRRTTPFVRLAWFGALVQLAVIYFFNTVSKNGPTWSQGTSIYYLLQQDRQITEFGYWMRGWSPFWLTKAITFSALIIEGVLPALLLLPITQWTRRRLWGLTGFVLVAYIAATTIRFVYWGRLQDNWPYALLPILYLAPLYLLRSTRITAWLFIVGLHVGIAAVSNVGLFSWAMIAAGTMFFMPEDLDRMGRWLRRLSVGPIRVRYDASVGVYHFLARVVRRLDVFGYVRWEALDDGNGSRAAAGARTHRQGALWGRRGCHDCRSAALRPSTRVGAVGSCGGQRTGGPSVRASPAAGLGANGVWLSGTAARCGADGLRARRADGGTAVGAARVRHAPSGRRSLHGDCVHNTDLAQQ